MHYELRIMNYALLIMHYCCGVAFFTSHGDRKKRGRIDKLNQSCKLCGTRSRTKVRREVKFVDSNKNTILEKIEYSIFSTNKYFHILYFVIINFKFFVAVWPFFTSPILIE